jgi:uncharacterized protein (TIGR02301 family)
MRRYTVGQRMLSGAVLVMAAVAVFGIATIVSVRPAAAAPASADSRPYDTKLLRLAELLGAIHYLRELCGANEGQFWRDTMMEVMKTEGSSAVRRARLTRSFNQGYRNYSRTYNVCTPTAKANIDRFLAEGAELAAGLSADGT